MVLDVVKAYTNLIQFITEKTMQKAKRPRQNIAICLGLLVGTGCILWLFLPVNEVLLMPGEMNTGHQNIACDNCHLLATGNLRQQIQANVRFILGLRLKAADYGRSPVTSEQCLSCHRRPDDRHPVFLFFEPRFKEARKKLQPQLCISCHAEHSDVRVTISDIGFCRTCHEKLVLREDPISTSHAQLIKQKQWKTCLGCHDFHGNHKMTTPRELDKALAPQKIRHYFNGADSPYSKEKHHQPLKEPQS